MNFTQLTEHLSEMGIVGKKQADGIKSAMAGHQAAGFRQQMESSGAEIEKLYDALVDHGYSKKSKYAKGAAKAIKKSVKSCADYAAENNRKTPTKQANEALVGQLKKFREAIPERGEGLKSDIRRTVGEAVETVKIAIATTKSKATSENAIANLSAAEQKIAGIEAKLAEVVDAASRNAAAKAGDIIDCLNAAASDLVTGNHSSDAAKSKLDEAMKLASEWGTVKLGGFGREAKETEIKTASALSSEIVVKAKIGGARNKIRDAFELVDTKLANTSVQDTKLDDIKAKRKAERVKIEQLEDDKQQIIADYQAGVLDSEEAKEKILDIQKQVSRCEERIEGFNFNLERLGGAAEAYRDKLEELRNILENIDFYADDDTITVELSKSINFRALNAFISGVSTDVVIDEIVNMDTVAAIVGKQMQTSAETVKEKLKQGRVLTTHKSKNEVSLEDQVKRSQQNKQDADDFMQSIINGAAGGTGAGKGDKTKIEIPTGGAGEVLSLLADESDV